MTTKVLRVPDISCAHCKASIEGAVGAVAGVRSVAVDVAGKSVRVELDAGFGLDAVVAAIEGQGYEVAPAQGA